MAFLPRWINILGSLIVFTIIWTVLYSDVLNLKLSKPMQEVIETFPLWSLVALGAYALGNIGINLILFRCCPEAAVELQKDIDDAKADLKKHGFVLDY